MHKTTLASLLAAAAGLLAVPATGHAATTTGSDLAAPAASTVQCASACTLGWGAHGWFDRKLMDGTIVTGWSADLAPGTRARLRLVRREGDAPDAALTAVAASEWVTGSAAGGVQSFKAHLPVTEYGLRFAVDVEGGGLGVAADPEREFGVVRIVPALEAGETRSGDRHGGEPRMQVTTEGDADGDGKGDDTEDDCVFGCTPAGGKPAGGATSTTPPAGAPAGDVLPASTGGAGGGAGGTATERKPAFQVDTRGLLRAGAQGRQGWFDVFVLNDSAGTFSADIVVKSGSRKVGGGRIDELEGGDGEKLAIRLGARERRQLQRTGRLKLTLEGKAKLANGYVHELRQALTVLTGGDARYDGVYRGPGPFVLVVDRGTVQTINASVLGYCPESNRQQSLNIFTVDGFPALVGRDGSFAVTDGRAVGQTNTYRGRLTLKGAGKGYASAFKAQMNMSGGGRFYLEGCTGATNWTVKKARR